MSGLVKRWVLRGRRKSRTPLVTVVKPFRKNLTKRLEFGLTNTINWVVTSFLRRRWRGDTPNCRRLLFKSHSFRLFTTGRLGVHRPTIVGRGDCSLILIRNDQEWWGSWLKSGSRIVVNELTPPGA